MASLFGHTWVSQYGADPAGEAASTWASALAGVTGEQLAAGMRETLVLGQEWPPSAPRFRALCFQIPSLGRMRKAITEPNPTPFTRLVWQHLDRHNFARADQSHADRMLKNAYEIAHEHVMRGGALPDPPTGLLEAPTPEVRKKASDDVVRKHCAEIEKLLGEKPDPEPEEVSP